MIEIKSPFIDNDFFIKEGYISVLEIHNKQLFREVIQGLNIELNLKQEASKLVFYNNTIKLNINLDVFIVQDFFNLDINSTKMLKSLYSKIEKDFIQENDEFCILEKSSELIKSIGEILIDYDFSFSYKEQLSIGDLLKVMNLKFNHEIYVDLVENIYYLFDIISLFKICEILIFVNLKSYLNDEELNEIYKMALHKNVKLLLIEQNEDSILKKYEKKLMIDSDFDEFMI